MHAITQSPRMRLVRLTFVSTRHMLIKVLPRRSGMSWGRLRISTISSSFIAMVGFDPLLDEERLIHLRRSTTRLPHRNPQVFLRFLKWAVQHHANHRPKASNQLRGRLLDLRPNRRPPILKGEFSSHPSFLLSSLTHKISIEDTPPFPKPNFPLRSLPLQLPTILPLNLRSTIPHRNRNPLHSSQQTHPKHLHPRPRPP